MYCRLRGTGSSSSFNVNQHTAVQHHPAVGLSCVNVGLLYFPKYSSDKPRVGPVVKIGEYTW